MTSKDPIARAKRTVAIIDDELEQTGIQTNPFVTETKDVAEILMDILTELKIGNMNLAQITNSEINAEDVED